jgi:hypothetical protein
MEPTMMSKSLQPALAKPEVLAEVCRVSVGQLGPVRAEDLTLTEVKAQRKIYPSPGHGTATVAYRRAGLPSCSARIRFDFHQEDGRGRPSITNLSVLPD